MDISEEYKALEDGIEQLEQDISRLSEQITIKREEKKRLVVRYEKIKQLDADENVEKELEGLSEESRRFIKKLREAALNSVKEGNLDDYIKQVEEDIDNSDEGEKGKRSNTKAFELNKYICYRDYYHNGEFNCAFIGFLGDDAKVRRDKWKEYLVNKYIELQGTHLSGKTSKKKDPNAKSDTARSLKVLNDVHSFDFSDKNGKQLELHGITFDQLKEIALYDFTSYPPKIYTQPTEVDSSIHNQTVVVSTSLHQPVVEKKLLKIEDIRPGDKGNLIINGVEVEVVEVVNLLSKTLEVKVEGESDTQKVKFKEVNFSSNYSE